MSRASLRTLKWPDSVESASGKCSAISPALRSRARSSRRISRRVGSLRARKTLSSCRRASELISSTNEIYAAGPASARVFGGVADTPGESIASRSVRLASTLGFLRVRDRTYETVRDSTRATPGDSARDRTHVRSRDVEHVTIIAPEARASSPHGVSSMLPPDLLEQVRQ